VISFVQAKLIERHDLSAQLLCFAYHVKKKKKKKKRTRKIVGAVVFF